MKRVNRTTCSLSLDRVDGRPFQVDGVDQPWAVYISSPSKVIEEQLVDVAGLLAANPSAALLRVFGEVPRVQHVLRLPSAAAVVPLLKRCEAIGLFDSADVAKDQERIVQELNDHARPVDDEACLLRAILPRPVVFLRPGHEDIDVVCERADAERLLIHLLEQGYP